jgi:protein phosphatase methylesterase 1
MSSDDSFVPWNKYWATKTLINTDRGSFNTYSTSSETDFVVLCVHGAGHSGLSFSLLAKELLSIAQVFAPDLKCHGETPGNPAVDLSLENLVADVITIARQILPAGKRLLIVGHSLGGSIAIRSAYTLKPAGVFVMDTIEGIAMAAMPNMKHILGGRPQSFESAKDVIRYIGSSGEMMSRTSAAVSAAGRVCLKNGRYEWITNLLPSEPFWIDWFKGFADAFLKAPTYKILILPHIDRLDTPFTIGHMSGKFQLEIVHGTNHCMHEDQPRDIAEIIKGFIERLTAVPYWK